MNDFLTRMAQFSRGEAMVVTPRLPSLFAPTEDTNTPQTDEVSLLQMSKKETRLKLPLDSIITAADTGQPQPPTAINPSEDHTIRYKPESEQAEMSLVPLITPPGNTNGSVQTASPVVTTNEGRIEIQNHGRYQSNPAPSPLKDETQAPPKTAHIETSFESVTTMHGQQASNEEKLSQPLVPGHRSKQTAQQQAMTDLPTSIPVEAQHEPTVHINIGRVEVRAQSSAPAPPPRPLQPKPKSSLSLNDYLTRRGGRS